MIADKNINTIIVHVTTEESNAAILELYVENPAVPIVQKEWHNAWKKSNLSIPKIQPSIDKIIVSKKQ